MAALKEKVRQVFPKPKRFTVKEVEKLYKLGFLKPDERIELINGEIYRMSPIGLRHSNVVDILSTILNEIIFSNAELKEKYTIRIQSPIQLSKDNLPEPDIAVLKKDYLKENRYPQPKDVEVLIEVSDTTLSFDKNVKLPLYAKYGIKQVWIVNLVEKQIEIYENLEKGKYKDIHIKTKENELNILNNIIKVNKIFL